MPTCFVLRIGDGSLSFDEASMALHRYGLMMAPDEVLWLFTITDKDESHSLDFDEFKRLVLHWKEFHEEYKNLVAPTS